MTFEKIRAFMLWSSLINYAILIVWFLAFTFARDFIYRLHSRWFHLSNKQFDIVHYRHMAIYKIGILLLNLVPLIALWIVS